MKRFIGFIFILLFSFSAFSKKKEKHNTLYQFIANHGQFHDNVNFRTDLPNGYLYMENNTFTYHFFDGELLGQLHHGYYKGDTSNLAMRYHTYKVNFENANSEPKINTSKKRENYFNFFIGKDKSKWAGKVPAYEQVTYNELYPKIDLIMYRHEYDGLKYDLKIAPGGDPQNIKLRYDGVDSIYLNNGKLYVITSLNENWEEKPEAWQIIDGKRKKVVCKYKLEGQTLTYDFPKGYDKDYELIIDPILIFSTYSGSTTNNFGYTATYDKFGFLYSGSSSFGSGYPTTVGAYQTTWAGGSFSNGTDIAITKWDTTGTSIIYSTYLGGTSDELPHSLVVTDFHELYIMGTTGSTDFPVTAGALDTSFNYDTPLRPVNLLNGVGVYYLNGSDIIVSKLDSSGSSLEASTFLGGTHTDGLNNGLNKFNYADEVRGEVDLDKNGNVYIASCTRSEDNPITTVGFQTTKLPPATGHIDGIVYKLNHNLSGLIWTNYLGGLSGDASYSIAITDSNDIYITGGTHSLDFPVTPLAFDTSYNAGNDGFVVNISENGDTLLNSTFYGTDNYDQSYFVELDVHGNVHLFGQTSGPNGALISNAMYHDSLGGQFIVKFKPQLDSVIWATRFGSGDGTPDISPTAFLVDVCSAIYLSGWGSQIQGSLSTTGLDTAGSPMQGTTDGQDFYVMVMSDDANSLLYGTFMGGTAAEHVDGGTSRFDRKGKVYQAVCAGCQNGSFPTFPNPGAHSTSNNAPGLGCNLAVFKMDFLLPIVIADFDVPTVGCAPFTVHFDNLSVQQSATNFYWSFGDGTTSTQFEPNHTYTSAGIYQVKLVLTDGATCNLSDSLIREITVLNDANTTLPDAVVCNGEPIQIGIPQNNDPNLNLSWVPSLYLSDTAISNPYANPSVNTTYTLVIDNGLCFDTVIQTVVLDDISAQIHGDTSVCSIDAPFLLNSTVQGSPSNYHWSNFADFTDTINANPNATQVLVTPPDSVNYFYLEVTSSFGCTVKDTFLMIQKDVLNPINAAFSDPGPGCAPYSVLFQNTTDSTAFTTYLWNFGNGLTSTLSNPSTTFNTKGDYVVTLIAFDSSICPQSDTFRWQVQARADSNYTVNQMVCYGQDTEIGIPADTVPNTTYDWIPTTGLSDPTINNPTVNITQNTSYLLVVNHVCTDSVTNNITVEPIFANSDSLHIICSDNPVVNLKGSSNGTGVNYIWSSLSNLGDTLNSSLADSTMNTTQLNTYQYYYFQVESNNGCFEKDSTFVVISDQTITASPDDFICHLDTVFIHAKNNFLPNAMDFYWSPANAIIGKTDTTSIQVAPLTDTYYYLSAINDSGCVFKDTVLVEVSKINPQNVTASAMDDSVLFGFSTVINATPPTGFLYSWTPKEDIANPDESSSEAAPQQTTTYTLLVTDPQNGTCSYKDEVTIVVYEINCGEPDIFIPNAFSPNSDGENDAYQITGKVIQTIELQIYNRWGELVFETTDLNESWDGKFNGKPVDPNVFVYQLKATCIDNKEFIKKGNITVIR